MSLTATLTKTRQLTGIKPTGRLQLGNLLGAINPLIAAQDRCDSIVMIVDLHALTVEHDPKRVREQTLEQARVLLAAGVDPERTTMYIQSHVPEHAQLHYLLECTTGFGEARRMIQFREKSAGPDPVRLSLLTYPVLQAADILLHDTDEVPVGEDQSQHLELARDVAYRFNTRYGKTFTVPRGVHPPVAARIMDLADPEIKMGKSNQVTSGVIGLLDPPELVRRKVMRAVTDTRNVVRRDRDRQPGVTNLLEIYGACTGSLDADFASYGDLKTAVADAVIATLEPLQRNYSALPLEDVKAVLRDGAQRARPRAAATLRRATEAIGLFAAF
ncbi:MAG TPA: tryptophan--tRNA ligase [Candidatus Limnocylindrales bacterium]|nr:tryptophan--tRNA ligase [Candidatus Limnocylindrales bacterium]